MEPLPRTAIYVARVQLALAALALLAALVGGVFMQLELWAPGATWSADWYGTSMLVHGIVLPVLGTAVFAGGFGYSAVGRFIGERMPAPAIGWVGVGLWTIGLIATVATWFASSQDTGWTFYTPSSIDASPPPPLTKLIGPLAFGAAGLVYGLHLAIMVAANSKAPRIRIALGGVLVLVTLWAAIGELRDAFAIMPVIGFGEPAMLLALIVVTIALAGDGAGMRSTLAVVAAGCAVAFVASLAWSFGPEWLLWGLALAVAWFTLGVIGGFGRPVVAFAVFGIAPVILMLGIARGLAGETDVFLHDTHFEVGLVHLAGMIGGFALLGAGHAFAVWRVPNSILAWGGAILTCAGAILYVYASLRVGGRGMPRRYWDFDPQFTEWHRVAGGGAAITLLGLLLILIGWLVGERRPTS